jgi:hypothetical protein
VVIYNGLALERLFNMLSATSLMKENFALLIAGNEPRHERKVVDFANFLLEKCFDQSRITLTVIGNGHPRGLIKETNNFFQKTDGATPVLIMYYGHGVKGHVGYDTFLSYDDWAQCFHPDSRTLFINVSCYSASCLPSFRRYGLLPDAGQVIASSRRGEDSYGAAFIDRLTESYRRGEPFRKRKIGTLRLVGKDIVDVPSDDCEDTILDDGTIRCSINDLGSIRFIPYRTPKECGHVRHPIKVGLDLEHIIYR